MPSSSRRGSLCAALAGGCSKKDFNREVVATVNGEEITVLELREYLGAPTGIFAFTDMPVEQKRKAVDQLIAGRLVVQAGRALGLDNTQEYKETLKKNEIGVRVDALIRKEAGEKLKLDEKEIKAEAEKIKEENAGISEAEATGTGVEGHRRPPAPQDPEGPGRDGPEGDGRRRRQRGRWTGSARGRPFRTTPFSRPPGTKRSSTGTSRRSSRRCRCFPSGRTSRIPR